MMHVTETSCLNKRLYGDYIATGLVNGKTTRVKRYTANGNIDIGGQNDKVYSVEINLNLHGTVM